VSFKIEVEATGLDFDLADRTTTVKCPDCKTMNAVTLGQVQREESIVCAGCHKAIKLVDKDHSVAKVICDVNEAFDDLRKALADLGARL